jgi:hypothetical protein
MTDAREREREQNSSQNSWQHTQNANYLELIKNRIESVELTWVTQFLDSLINLEKLNDNLTIKDIGCQTFQVYKQIKSKNLSYQYFGYELDKTYIDFGLKYFPELQSKVTLGNFLEIKEPIHTDISVCSATIEHIDNWILFLEKILGSTSDYVYIRTFLGETTQRVVGYHSGAAEGYPIWQFSFQDMFTAIRDFGFYPELRKDTHTESLPRLLNVSPNGIIRSTYVIQAKRIRD